MKGLIKHTLATMALCSSMIACADTVLESSWRDVVRGTCSDQTAGWWSSDEAIRIARNVLLYQREIGGWPKNTNMQLVLTEEEKNDLIESKSRNQDCTIDNGAVSYELTYLSKVYEAISDESIKTEIRDGFVLGIEYLIEAQYDNGGWPQYYPQRGGYSDHITYNDNAMINVMEILRHIYENDGTYSIAVDESIIDGAKQAFDKGLECILNTQWAQNGLLTAWCAQHDYESLEPAEARSYELPSISGQESSGILDLLMSIDNPSEAIMRAVHSGANWYEEVKIMGIRLEDYVNEDGLDDIRVVEDPDAGPLWARFYTLEDNRPFFCDRDGIKKFSLAEIGHERRNGYSWYGTAGFGVASDYASWIKKWGKTILASPYEGQLIYTTDDTVSVRAYANKHTGSTLTKFELTLDSGDPMVFTSNVIDTLFVGLDSGLHTLTVKSYYADGSTESDGVSFSITPPSFKLEIIRGEGSGEYYKGSKIAIKADPPEDGQIFSNWAGDTTYVEDPFSEETTVTMPDVELRIVAFYKRGPVLSVDDKSLSSLKNICYPNPVRNERLTVDLSDFGDARIEIFSLDGRRTFSEWRSKGMHSLSIGELDQGMYLLKITGLGEHPYTQKLIVE